MAGIQVQYALYSGSDSEHVPTMKTIKLTKSTCQCNGCQSPKCGKTYNS